MTVLRLVSGVDLAVRVPVSEALALLRTEGDGGFVELPGEDGPVHVRPSTVAAVIEDHRRGSAGFRP